jgi:hypothetical protein
MLCVTVVKLTLHTLCRHFNSLYPDATKSVTCNDLTCELSVKFKRKLNFGVLVLFQQQIITAQ